MKRIYSIFMFLLQSVLVFADVYYVSYTGEDTNSGSIDSPLASIARAQELVSAGDTVYIREGTFILHESDVSRIHNGLFACYAFIDKSGTENNRINYWAYPGEQPVFDFSNVKPVDKRVVGFYITADYVHFKGLEITGVQVTITSHTESYCFYNYGSHNVFELLKLHDNQGTGIRHRKGAYNLFLNCDSYRNHDYTSEDGRGGNTDGFGCHPSAGGKGNVFRGCRSWFNSDDGYDFIGSAEVVKIENCWAMYNGYSTSFQSLADGNGFKAGGDAVTAVEDLPNPIPRHIVQFCLAVKNKASGFYANHHIGGINWYNNTAYLNGTNYNMLNRLDDNETDVPGYNHRMRNNLGYKGGTELRNIDREACDLKNNYFDLDVLVNEEDFKSLLRSVLTGPRQEDGSLPETDFMQLVRGSDLVDRGEDIGFYFEGYSPDLGAFEQGYNAFPVKETYWFQKYIPEYYWESGNEPFFRIFGLLWLDTIIEGKQYQRIYEFPDERRIPETAVYAGAVREDSLRRVFYRGEHTYPFSIPDTGEILLYDFSVNVGDTVHTRWLPGIPDLIVSLVDSVSIGDVVRPRIQFKNDPYTKWIEGMGSDRGFLFHAEELLLHGLWNDLVCFWEKEVPLFHNEEYKNCYEDLNSVEGGRIQRELLEIYPVPAGDIINLQFTKPFTGTIEVYDLQGRLNIEETIHEISCAPLNIDILKQGAYILQAKNKHYRITRLFVKE